MIFFNFELSIVSQFKIANVFIVSIYDFAQAGVEARVCPENYLMMAEPGERFAFHHLFVSS